MLLTTPNVASRGTLAFLKMVKLDSAATPHPRGWPRRKLDHRSPNPFKKKPRETSKRPKNYRCIAAIRPRTNLRPSLPSRPASYSGRDLAMLPSSWTNHPSGPLPKGRRLRLTKTLLRLRQSYLPLGPRQEILLRRKLSRRFRPCHQPPPPLSRWPTW